MKIRKNPVWLATWIVLFLQLGILGDILPFFGEHEWKIKCILMLLDSIYAFLVLYKCGWSTKYRLLNVYIIIYLICLMGISIYTVSEGVATVSHTFMYAQSYLSVLLVYPFLYLDLKYKKASFLESWMTVVAVILCLRMFNCFVYDYSGVSLIPGFIAGQVRNGHSTSICGAIENFFVLYSFYCFLNYNEYSAKRKSTYLLYVVIGLVFTITFVGSRMMIISILASMIVLWYGKQRGRDKKVAAFFVCIVVLAIFMQTSFYDDLL